MWSTFDLFFRYQSVFVVVQKVHSFVPKTNRNLRKDDDFVIQIPTTSGEREHRSDDGVARKIRDSRKTACCPIHSTGAALCCAVPTMRVVGEKMQRGKHVFLFEFTYYDKLRVLVRFEFQLYIYYTDRLVRPVTPIFQSKNLIQIAMTYRTTTSMPYPRRAAEKLDDMHVPLTTPSFTR